MKDRRIVMPGSCDGGCDDGCGGCGSIPILGGGDDTLFTPGTVIKSKLTGEKLMVIKTEADSPVTYLVRTSTYQIVQVFEFEVEAIEDGQE